MIKSNAIPRAVPHKHQSKLPNSVAPLGFDVGEAPNCSAENEIIAPSITTPLLAREIVSLPTVIAGPPTESVFEPITRVDPSKSVYVLCSRVNTAPDVDGEAGAFDIVDGDEVETLEITTPFDATLITSPPTVAAGPFKGKV